MVEEARIILLSRQQIIVTKAYIVTEPCKQFKSLLRQLLFYNFVLPAVDRHLLLPCRWTEMVNLNFGHIHTSDSQVPRGAVGKKRLPAVLSRGRGVLNELLPLLEWIMPVFFKEYWKNSRPVCWGINWRLFFKLVNYLIWAGRELRELFILLLTTSRMHKMKTAA